MVGGLAEKVVAADFGFGEKDRIGDDRRIHQMVAMTDDEFHHIGLIAFGKPVAPQPTLLEVRRVDHERISHELARREPLIGMRGPGGRMRTAVHPDRPESLGSLRPDMNGDQLHGMRVPVFPNAEVSHGAHLIRRDVTIALVVLESQPRRIVRKGPQASGFVNGESGVVSNLGTGSPLQTILVDGRRPIARKVDGRGWPGRWGGRRGGLSDQGDLCEERRRKENDIQVVLHRNHFPLSFFLIAPNRQMDSSPWSHSVS